MGNERLFFTTLASNMLSMMKKTNHNISSVKKLVIEAGNQTLLAEAVGVCQQAVCQWESKGYVPIRRISAVLRSFPNVVTADDLIADYMAATSKNTSSNHKKTKNAAP